MSPIWYIHGAGASPRSFAWLRTQLPPHQGFAVTHSVGQSVESIIARIAAAAEAEPAPVMLLGHSLGGLIAAGLVGRRNIDRIVTLSAPLAGLRLATVMGMLSHERLWADLNPYGSTVRGIRSRYTAKAGSHLAVVTTAGGLPLPSMDANDGVVAVSSQTAFSGPSYCFLPLNHFEVLLATETVAVVTAFLDTAVAD